MKFALAAASAALLLAACGEKAEPSLDGTPTSAATPAEPAPAPASPAFPTGPSAGKWKVSVSSGEMEIPPNEICYAKQMTMEEAQQMQQQSGLTCTEQTFSADGKSGHSVCALQGMTVTTDYAVTGDFNTAYTMRMTSTMDPSPPGMAAPSVTTVKMERLGDCDPGKTP
jgi:hypothetical protein